MDVEKLHPTVSPQWIQQKKYEQEQRRLDYNAPLLSVRRLADLGRNGIEGKTKSSLWKRSSELSSEPVHVPGSVPFEWEDMPGKPKHFSSSSSSPHHYSSSDSTSGSSPLAENLVALGHVSFSSAITLSDCKFPPKECVALARLEYSCKPSNAEEKLNQHVPCAGALISLDPIQNSMVEEYLDKSLQFSTNFVKKDVGWANKLRDRIPKTVCSRVPSLGFIRRTVIQLYRRAAGSIRAISMNNCKYIEAAPCGARSVHKGALVQEILKKDTYEPTMSSVSSGKQDHTVTAESCENLPSLDLIPVHGHHHVNSPSASSSSPQPSLPSSPNVNGAYCGIVTAPILPARSSANEDYYDAPSRFGSHNPSPGRSNLMIWRAGSSSSIVSLSAGVDDFFADATSSPFQTPRHSFASDSNIQMWDHHKAKNARISVVRRSRSSPPASSSLSKRTGKDLHLNTTSPSQLPYRMPTNEENQASADQARSCTSERSHVVSPLRRRSKFLCKEPEPRRPRSASPGSSISRIQYELNGNGNNVDHVKATGRKHVVARQASFTEHHRGLRTTPPIFPPKFQRRLLIGSPTAIHIASNSQDGVGWPFGIAVDCNTRVEVRPTANNAKNNNNQPAVPSPPPLPPSPAVSWLKKALVSSSTVSGKTAPLLEVLQQNNFKQQTTSVEFPKKILPCVNCNGREDFVTRGH